MDVINLPGRYVRLHQLARSIEIENSALRALVVTEDLDHDGRIVRSCGLERRQILRRSGGFRRGIGGLCGRTGGLSRGSGRLSRGTILPWPSAQTRQHEATER